MQLSHVNVLDYMAPVVIYFPIKVFSEAEAFYSVDWFLFCKLIMCEFQAVQTNDTLMLPWDLGKYVLSRKSIMQPSSPCFLTKKCEIAQSAATIFSVYVLMGRC